MALSQFKNKANLFAFTNGQPGSCYSDRDVTHLDRMGARKIFTTRGGVNRDPNQLLLGRMVLSQRDIEADQLWFRAGRAALNSL